MELSSLMNTSYMSILARLNGNKKSIRRVIREFVLAHLPRSLAHRWIKSSLDLSGVESSSNIRFMIASQIEDLKAALVLLQENFEREGYARKVPGSLRITPFHLLPETIVIVGKVANRVVATISVIPRTKFGVPLDKSCQLDPFLSATGKVVEISGLAVHPDFRGQRGAVLFKLMKFMYHCNVDLVKANTEIIGVNPKMQDLYEAVLLFKNIPSSKTIDYDFANGAPVVPMYFDLDTAPDSYAMAYSGSPPHRNLMSFMLKRDSEEYTLPNITELDQLLPQRNPETLREMLSWSPEIFKSMAAESRAQLVDLYGRWPECSRLIRELSSAH